MRKNGQGETILGTKVLSGKPFGSPQLSAYVMLSPQASARLKENSDNPIFAQMGLPLFHLVQT